MQTLGSGQAGVDDGVTVVMDREVIQSGLDGPGGLIKCGVADGVKFDLHTGTIGLFAEFGDLLIGIVENAAIIGALIGFQQSGIHGAEASIQCCLKTAADAFQATALCLFYIHGLEIHTHLQTVGKTTGKPVLHIHIRIQGKANAADGMDHADSLVRQMVCGFLHILQKLRNGDGAGHEVGNSKEGLLIHFAGVHVAAPQTHHLFLHKSQESRVDHTGVTVIFDHEQGFVGTDGIQFLTGDEFSFGHAVGRCAECNDHFIPAGGNKVPDHIQDLTVAPGVGDIQTCMERSKAGKMDVTVTKGRDQSPVAKLESGEACVFCRQFIAHMDDPTAVFHQITINMILRIAGQNGAFIYIHNVSSLVFEMIISYFGRNWEMDFCMDVRHKRYPKS